MCRRDKVRARGTPEGVVRQPAEGDLTGGRPRVTQLPVSVGDLGLETIGLTLDKRGIVPTYDSQTSVPGVWAIGDVPRGPMLAHKAEDKGVACVLEMLAALAGLVDYDIMPNVVYTSPGATTKCSLTSRPAMPSSAVPRLARWVRPSMKVSVN